MATNRRVTKSTAKAVVGKGRSKKKSLWSKLISLPKPVIIGLWLIVFGAIGTKMVFFSGATAFQYVGTHPQAVNQPDTSTGRQLKSLAAWNGKVYAGYGDYDKNTGPVSVTPFNPMTNSFATTPEHIADTEEIEIWSTIGTKLYGVHTDPKSHNGATYSVADASSGKPVWTNVYKATMTHVFGIASLSPTDLFLVGSLDEGSAYNEVAKVFRSTDGGVTWNQSLSVPSRGGFNRMMFVAKLGDKIYAQNLSTSDFNGAQPQTQAWVLSGTSWSKTTPIALTYNPHNGAEFAGKILAQTSPSGGSLVAYDGRSTTTVRSSVRDYKVHSDGYVYILTYANSDMFVMRSKDLTTWEQVTAAPNNSRSLAVLGNTLYIGTSDSEMFKAEINPLITDTTPPSATLIAPTAAYTATTSNEFAVNASDISSIDKVEFYVGETLIGYTSGKASSYSGCFSIGGSESCFTHTTNYPGSYALKWNGSGVASGTYALKAIAYDIYGNSRSTASATITVPAGLYPPDTEKPTITVTSPSATQRIRKSVWVAASATDNDQVASFEVVLDGNVVSTASTGSISKSFPVTRGSHTLVVHAKDRAGNTSEKVQTFTSR